MMRKEFFMNFYKKDEHEPESEEIGVKLDGFVLPLKDGEKIGHNEFLNKFLDFLEAEGWSYTGGSVQIDFDGNAIEDIDD
ncbi:hypothetical protein E3U55_16745 [Filobacillus milosensis]|uniref:Uncharacterized protein n=1 Tax=Filobacillus milosensis TaxID=94137 RepID=A0A4Y8IDC0_9BACI|nr:hypothetical protein [Filobacillus milosensis]TFB13027.1 hypothetical protein E3U55_16745 [Filobacillus milosensis]